MIRVREIIELQFSSELLIISNQFSKNQNRKLKTKNNTKIKNMKKTLTLVVVLFMMAVAAMAQDEKVGESSAEAEVKNQISVQDLYSQQVAMATDIAGFPELVSAYMPSDLYSIDWSYETRAWCGSESFEVPVLHYLHHLPRGENSEYLPVFEAIYNYLSDLTPSSYMTENAAIRFAFVNEYAGFLSHQEYLNSYKSSKNGIVQGDSYSSHPRSDIIVFFKEKEKAMGENSIRSRLERFLDENPGAFMDVMNAIQSMQESFYGYIRKDGKFKFSEGH